MPALEAASIIRMRWLAASALLLGCQTPAAEPFARFRAPAGPSPSARPAAKPSAPVQGPPGAPAARNQAASPTVRLSVEQQEQLDALLQAALRRGDFPGAVVVIGRRSGVLFRRAYGRRAIQPAPVEMSEDTLFDLASLTKPIATATSIVLLVERARAKLEDPLAVHLPELANRPIGRASLRHLLEHTSGLPAANALSSYARGMQGALGAIAELELSRPPGDRFAYSDLGYILLGEVVSRASGRDLAEFSDRYIFEPLQLSDTVFLPGEALRARAAPSARREGGFLQGQVHDPRAALLGGVSGHAGLFSSADDVSRFARMLPGKGRLEGIRVLSEASVAALIEPRALSGGRRALGWDAPDQPERTALSARAFNHTGFTGTSLMVDPELDLFVVFLSSRLHPRGRGEWRSVLAPLHALASGVVRDLPHEFAAVDPPVLNGIDVLRREGFRRLAGKRVGLITNKSGRARDGRSTVELLARAPGVRLNALFSPEHGLDSSREGPVRDEREKVTGLLVESLYGARQRPSTRRLERIDLLVFDVQDAGTRFYTYGSTLRSALQAAAEADIAFLLLDRPNPIGGSSIEGPVLGPGRASFVNYHALPVRHGLTLGELARLLVRELDLRVRLDVVRLEGWSRDLHYRETGLPWVPPSPNLGSPEAALLYPCTGLFERSNLSVGRGTAQSFEQLGAPWLDGRLLAARLLDRSLRGVHVEPAVFTPGAGPYRGRACRGIRLVVTDAKRFRPVRSALVIAQELAALHPELWKRRHFDDLLADRAAVRALFAGQRVEEVEARWHSELELFRKRRAPALLYPDTRP